ncbi:BatA domain-containing protein [Microbulbifer sp. OS29]|uniref:BatA domain-containing protein n=1 Tax=Microbulbifer okhotskensis TaxID=2926617 RepID=A0A9X2J625_9GAMM|nr:BatA domain-containing protein [Microbulbifer okhotskensis]MCO1333016.1 BatA domain-containing protein [Microbulbifer okhotskensis]
MLWINSIFQSPQWLWLFAALTIPIAIHLLRRSNPQQISFAALQWVQRYSQSRARRPAVDNKWLLLFRLLIVAILAILLSQPLIKRNFYPQEIVVLVDSRIPAETAMDFIHSSLPQLTEANYKVLWLSPETTAITSPPEQNVDLWKTLSLLSRRAELRYAHILLINNTFPTAHQALRSSPHWQWHSLNKPTTPQSPLLPRLATMGEVPNWWIPLLQDWRRTMPGLSVQTLGTEEIPNAEQTDWLIYAGPAPLPQAVSDFVVNGGLLITDNSIQAPGDVAFVFVPENHSVQAAPLGRGSWLRYQKDWHSADFYRRADLPNALWQQWSAQDWPLQHLNRGQWSGSVTMGIAVADTDIERRRSEQLQPGMIIALLLLLTLERLLALSRAPAHRRSKTPPGSSEEPRHG